MSGVLTGVQPDPLAPKPRFAVPEADKPFLERAFGPEGHAGALIGGAAVLVALAVLWLLWRRRAR